MYFFRRGHHGAWSGENKEKPCFSVFLQAKTYALGKGNAKTSRKPQKATLLLKKALGTCIGLAPFVWGIGFTFLFYLFILYIFFWGGGLGFPRGFLSFSIFDSASSSVAIDSPHFCLLCPKWPSRRRIWLSKIFAIFVMG